MDISSVFKIMKPGSILLRVFQSICMKSVKYFIDSKIRQHVTPVPGSVLYCDLWVAVEHSGIYVGDGKISNIVVDGIAESSVSYSSAADFTSKSILGRKIYVSCNKDGAVGNSKVAHGADNHIGERVLYGYFLKIVINFRLSA